MSVTDTRSLSVTRTFTAPRERVFDAWTRPEEVRRWSCPTPGGVRSYTAELRVGGSYRLEMDEEGEVMVAFGVYREITRPARLVYTWDWEGEHAMGETVVTVEFAEVPGGTEVRLVHSGFPADEAREAHETGWDACLDTLGALLR